MKSWRNLFLRSFLMMSFHFISKILNLKNDYHRRIYRKTEKANSKINDYEDLIEELQTVFEKMKGPKKWIQTSGTRSTPKLIPYNNKRSSKNGRFFLKSMIILTSHLKGLKTFFVFSSIEKDSSLTSELLNQKDPTLLELLQAPYRYLTTPGGEELRKKFSDLELRFFLIVITRPRIFYATNPSTLTHFIQELEKNWEKIKEKTKTLLENENYLNPLLKLADGDALTHINKLSEGPFDLQQIFSKLQAIVTWDGGYLSVFLEALREKLPWVEIIPMYSMSTEAILTSPHKIKNKVYFLPISPGVKTFFKDLNSNLIYQPFDLKINQDYEMIITDEWGLKNYSTKDIFRVKDIIHGWPDLHFIKRKGINSSITGEKITEEQAKMLFHSLKNQFTVLRLTTLSLIPSQIQDKFFYQLAFNGEGLDIKSIDSVENYAEQEMQEINKEYASKIKSGRLSPIQIIFKTPAEFAAMFNREKDWESQFKILPLYENIIQIN